MEKESRWAWSVLLIGFVIFLWLAFKPFREFLNRIYDMVMKFF